MKWTDDAACVGRVTPFDRYEQGGIAAHEADAMCLSCPVIRECFIMGSRGEHGQWGGVFWDGNGRPDPKANAHKSEEYIAKVQRAVNGDE